MVSGIFVPKLHGVVNLAVIHYRGRGVVSTKVADAPLTSATLSRTVLIRRYSLFKTGK